jgi:xylulose-5-phosphate/fructose-6-phosphate phosphoketolase
MIVLRTPKGWTGPKEVDGKKTDGFWRSHQVPLAEVATNEGHRRQLEQWLRSYRPETLFDESGHLMPPLAALAPKGVRRMGANPHANGGVPLRELKMPDFREFAVAVPKPATVVSEATRVLGTFLREVMRLNQERRNFRVFGPDETASNRLGALFEVTDRTWLADRRPEDESLGPDGRVMEILASTAVRAGSKAISSPGATGSSRATRPSSTSSTRCSINTRSG